jgi:hypothetical protein
MFGHKNRDASISVVVSSIISIVMVPTMVPVQAVPPIFVRVTIVAVASMSNDSRGECQRDQAEENEGSFGTNHGSTNNLCRSK